MNEVENREGADCKDSKEPDQSFKSKQENFKLDTATGSQCRSAKIGVMWAERLVRVRIRAAKF